MNAPTQRWLVQVAVTVTDTEGLCWVLTNCHASHHCITMQSVIKIFAYLLGYIIIVEYAEYYQLQMSQTPIRALHMDFTADVIRQNSRQ